MVKQIIKEAIEKNPIGLKEAVEAELMSRVQLALEAKKTSMEDEEEIEESFDLSENFKRGDIIEVPGKGNTKHKAVMLSPATAVYLDDDGDVEMVPPGEIKNSKKSKRTSKSEKDLAKEYLSNMKEDLDETFDLQEKTIKDLGGGVKVAVDSDGSATVSDRSAPGGTQMVVLEPNQVAKMRSVVKSNKTTKGLDLGGGVKLTLDTDGSVVISDRSAPGGGQMVVLEPKQIKEIIALVK